MLRRVAGSPLLLLAAVLPVQAQVWPRVLLRWAHAVLVPIRSQWVLFWAVLLWGVPPVLLALPLLLVPPWWPLAALPVPLSALPCVALSVLPCVALSALPCVALSVTPWEVLPVLPWVVLLWGVLLWGVLLALLP